ncbi:peptidoglycan DD-metalloendopeptidase family protein [Paenibacillus sp. N1-5-1-14]|uniref:murein hydrolase activator EnvC family protein n=1 Tax=Paenibacillus radicibacter TaxID=2972488 RepID=UPI0021598931|nr:M23 family metallopeptidase [Paenibacillus radicibacter]MCR8645002.1 peptidoglycan DD-metalloendopeptidase family protein [Paenibacillus radicibacter]
MKKKIVPFVLVAAMLLTINQPTISLAASSAKINKELEAIRKEKEAAEKAARNTKSQIQEVKKDQATTKLELADINTQLNKSYAELNKLNVKLEATETELNNQAKQLDEAEARVERRNDLLESRVRMIYTNGPVSYLEVLFSATSFSDFINRLDLLKSIVGQDKDILESNKKDRDIVVDKKQQVAVKLGEVKVLLNEATAVKLALQSKEREKEVRVAQLEKKEEQLEHISEEDEERLIAFARKEAQKIAERNKAIQDEKNKNNNNNNNNNQPAYNGGKFGFPLPKSYPITSGYGSRIDPITGKADVFHKGIDFGAPRGTAILAGEAGNVILAGQWSGYGNTVIIDHGKGVWTLYGHIREGGIIVKQGQAVKRGQKIAEVGSTGQSTGNHLHFEVRINESPVNPGPYLK